LKEREKIKENLKRERLQRPKKDEELGRRRRRQEELFFNLSRHFYIAWHILTAASLAQSMCCLAILTAIRGEVSFNF